MPPTAATCKIDHVRKVLCTILNNSVDNTKSPEEQTSPDRAPIHPPEGINASAAQTQIHPTAAASLFTSKVTFSSGGNPMFPLAGDAAQHNPGLTWQANR